MYKQKNYTHNHTYNIIQIPKFTSLKCMFLDSGTKLEVPRYWRKVHTGMENIQTPHRKVPVPPGIQNRNIQYCNAKCGSEAKQQHQWETTIDIVEEQYWKKQPRL